MARLVALIALLVAGMLSLPLAAFWFDDEGSENWILPVQLGGMGLVGALVAVAVPTLTRKESGPVRRAVVGAVLGIVMAVLGVVVFFLILNGFDGA